MREREAQKQRRWPIKIAPTTLTDEPPEGDDDRGGRLNCITWTVFFFFLFSLAAFLSDDPSFLFLFIPFAFIFRFFCPVAKQISSPVAYFQTPIE